MIAKTVHSYTAIIILSCKFGFIFQLNIKFKKKTYKNAVGNVFFMNILLVCRFPCRTNMWKTLCKTTGGYAICMSTQRKRREDSVGDDMSFVAKCNYVLGYFFP